MAIFFLYALANHTFLCCGGWNCGLNIPNLIRKNEYTAFTHTKANALLLSANHNSSYDIGLQIGDPKSRIPLSLYWPPSLSIIKNNNKNNNTNVNKGSFKSLDNTSFHYHAYIKIHKRSLIKYRQKL